MHYFKSLRVLFILALALNASHLMAQNTGLKKPITISIVNKRFDNAIRQIQEESKVNLCYNSDIIPKNKLVTVRANHNRLDKVLAPLLASVNLQMKEVNDQIIITKSPNPAPQEVNTPRTTANQSKTEVTGKIVTIPDTVYYVVHDTIVKTIYDTIKITVYDTKVVKQLNKSVVPWSPKFSVDLSCAMMYQVSKNTTYPLTSGYRSFFEQYENAGKNKYGYSVGSNFAIRNKRLELSAGIELYKLIHNINGIELPKYYDNIDSSIISTTMKPNGTFYTYKVDTTTLDINYDPFKWTFTNSYLFIGFPISLSYKLIQTSKIEIGLSLGITYSRLISSKGFDANLSNGNQLFKNKNGESVLNENISLTAGFEIDYPLTSYISLATICRYRKSITSTYQKSSPIAEKPAYIYPAIALKYKF